MSNLQAVGVAVGVSLLIGVVIPLAIITFWDNKDRPYGRDAWDRFMTWSLVMIAWGTIVSMTGLMAFVLIFRS